MSGALGMSSSGKGAASTSGPDDIPTRESNVGPPTKPTGTCWYCRRMSRTDRVSRVISAQPEKVFAALVDPEALLAWLPPEGMKGQFERFDARPGGSYRLVLTYDGGVSRGKATADSDVVEARFLSLVPGVQVVQAVDFVSDDPSFAGTMTMNWDISSVDEGTLVEITADAVPDGISADDHAAGMASSLANLAAYLGS